MGVMGVGTPPTCKNAPANEGGLRVRLIEAAMRRCDHQNDSIAARAEIVQDCLATPTHLAKELMVHFGKTYGSKT